MKLKNQFQKISLLISINTEEFQKFLQAMMKLKNQVAHINQQSFTHPNYKHSETQKSQFAHLLNQHRIVLQNWKQNCWYWGGGAAAAGYNF